MESLYDMERMALRLKGFRHKFITRSFSRVLPFYIVNEFPKSGGSWLTEMISEATNLPFRRNTPIRLEKCVTHGHFLNPMGLHNVLVLWRDPRDVIVSLYFHSFFVNEYGNKKLVSIMRKHLPFSDYHDVRNNLTEFIKFIILTPDTPSYSWHTFADMWTNRPGTLQVKYEDLRADTVSELIRVVQGLTGEQLSLDRATTIVNNHTLEKAKARAQKQTSKPIEVSFIREGSTGGWKEYFTPEAHDLISLYFGKQMVRLGYEV